MEDICFDQQKHMPYFRRRMVWEIVKHTLLWCQACDFTFYSHPTAPKDWATIFRRIHWQLSLFLRQTCTPAPHTRKLLFLFSKDIRDGKMLEHKPLPHSPPFKFFDSWCIIWSIKIAAKPQRFFVLPSENWFWMTVPLTNKSYSDLLHLF